MKIIISSRISSFGLSFLLLVYLVLLPGCSQEVETYRVLEKADLFNTFKAVRLQGLQQYSLLRSILKRALQQQGLRVVGSKFRRSPILSFRALEVGKIPLTITRHADVGEYKVQVSLMASLHRGPNWLPLRKKFTSSTSFLNSPNRPFVAANEEKEVLMRIYHDLSDQIIDWLILAYGNTDLPESHKTRI